MLNFLFQGLFDLLSGVVERFFDLIMEAFAIGSGDFEAMFPVLTDIRSAFVAVGWSMLVLLFVISAMRSIVSPDSQRAEHPIYLVGRAFVSGLVLLSCDYLASLFLDYGSQINEAFSMIDPNGGVATGPGRLMLDAISTVGSIGLGTYTGGVTIVLQLVLLCILFYEIAKYVLECLTRYVTLCIGGYLSPLLAPMLVSRSTSSLFTSYLSFMGGHMILVWLSTVFMKLIVSGFRSFAGAPGLPFFFKYFVLLAVVKLAQQVDNILFRIGFKTVRQSGIGIAGSLAVAAGAIAATPFGKAVGGAVKTGMGGMQKVGRSVRGATGEKLDTLSGGRLSAASETIRSYAESAGGKAGDFIARYNPPDDPAKRNGAGARPDPRSGAAERESANESMRRAMEDEEARRDDIPIPGDEDAPASPPVGEPLNGSPAGEMLPDPEPLLTPESAADYAETTIPQALEGVPVEPKEGTNQVRVESLPSETRQTLETGIRQYASLVSQQQMTCSEVSQAHTGFTLSETGYWSYTNPADPGSVTIRGNLDSHELLSPAALEERSGASLGTAKEFFRMAEAPGTPPQLQTCYQSLGNAELANVSRMECIRSGHFERAEGYQRQAQSNVSKAARALSECPPDARIDARTYGLSVGNGMGAYQSRSDPSFAVKTRISSPKAPGSSRQK